MTAGGSRKPGQIKASLKHQAPSRSHEESAQPIELPLDLIDEDPHQPRTVFDPQLLEELAETIRQRGVKNPISVHRRHNLILVSLLFSASLANKNGQFKCLAALHSS